MRGEGDGLRFELPPDSAPSRRPLGLDGDRMLAQGAAVHPLPAPRAIADRPALCRPTTGPRGGAPID